MISMGKSFVRFLPSAVLWVTLAAVYAACRQFHLSEFFGAGMDRAAPLIPPFWKVTGERWAAYLAAGARVFWLSLIFSTTGHAILRRFKMEADNAWESLSWNFGLGAGVWAYLFLFLGLCGLLYNALLVGLLVLAGAASIRYLYFFRPNVRSLAAPFKGNWLALGAGVLFLIQACMILPYALVPDTFYDSLEYQLGLPHLYLLQHGIEATPDHSFSGIPTVPGMLFGWALSVDAWGGAAHLFNYSFLLWTFAALVGLGVRLKAKASGAVAAVLFAYSPVVGLAAYVTIIELSWGFYQILGVTTLLALLKASPGKRREVAVLAGIFLGCALATKYLAWALPLAYLAVAYFSRKETNYIRPKDAAITAAVAALCLAPWLIKNLIFYGNPVFPFLHGILAAGAEVQPGTGYLGEGAKHTLSAGVAAYLKAVFRAPWDMLHYENIVSDSINPLLLGLVPLWAMTRFSREEKYLLGYWAACWLPLALVVHLPRYYIPSLGILALISGLALARLEETWVRKSLATVLAMITLGVGFSMWRWTVPRSRWAVFTGEKSVEEFLSHASRDFYPAPLFPAAEYIRAHAGQDAKVLVFGDSRGFYLMRDHLNSTPFQVTVLERWSNASSSGEELKERFDKAGITHIIVNHAEIVRQKMALKFSPRGKKSLDDFWARYTLKVYQAGPNYMTDGGRDSIDQWVLVYRVLAEEEASRPHPADDLFADYSIN